MLGSFIYVRLTSSRVKKDLHAVSSGHPLGWCSTGAELNQTSMSAAVNVSITDVSSPISKPTTQFETDTINQLWIPLCRPPKSVEKKMEIY